MNPCCLIQFVLTLGPLYPCEQALQRSNFSMIFYCCLALKSPPQTRTQSPLIYFFLFVLEYGKAINVRKAFWDGRRKCTANLSPSLAPPHHLTAWIG